MADADIIAVPTPIIGDNPTDGAAIPSTLTTLSSHPSSTNPVIDAIFDDDDGGEDTEPDVDTMKYDACSLYHAVSKTST